MSRIRSGYNFQNVSVNYRYGVENPEPIPDFSQPIAQKQISFGLVGKSDRASASAPTQFLANPIFEEFEEIESIHTGIYADDTQPNIRIVDVTKILRLNGLSIINNGDNYTAANPITLSFSDLGAAHLPGGDGRIYEQPILNLTTVDGGGLESFSIIDGGRFQGSVQTLAYTGQTVYFSRRGTGFFGSELDEPNSGWEYLSGDYFGTGRLVYREFLNGVDRGIITADGTFSGNVFSNSLAGGGDTFIGTFTSDQTKTDVILDVENDNEFDLNIQDSFYETGALVFQTGQIQPIYKVRGSNPSSAANSTPSNRQDVRDGINYSNWNNLTEDPIDRQAYTHVVRNPNVDSVSAIFDIKRLNDTLHQAESDYKVTDKPNWLGRGDLEVDAVFRIGNPTDTFVTLRLEWGFLNTNSFSVSQVSYAGQTVGGYLVKGPDLTFSSWKSLQQSDPQYNDLTIDQLKSSFPKYVRVSKDMFEQDSSLIERSVMLDSISEKSNTNYSYPSSTIVGTKINSTYFDNIPTRTYDARLKKVWVPETYNIKHLIEDKRFRKNDITYGESQNPFYDPKIVFWPYAKDDFATSIVIGGGTSKSLFISTYSSQYHSVYSEGQILVYKNMAKGMNFTSDESYQMLRDGVPFSPSSTDFETITQGKANTQYYDSPVWNIQSNAAKSTYLSGGGQIITRRQTGWRTNSRIVFQTVVAVFGLINIRYGRCGYPVYATHSVFMRVTPRKRATFKMKISAQVESGDYDWLIKFCTSIVVGLVYDPRRTAPDRTLSTIPVYSIDGNHTRGTSSYGNYRDVSIPLYNTSQKDYMHVKIFTAQTRQIYIVSKLIVYGLVQYARPGMTLPQPNYYTLAPNGVSISHVSLEDENMKPYNLGEVLGEKNGFLFVDGEKARNYDADWWDHGDPDIFLKSLIIFKLNKNGFWYPYQDIQPPILDKNGYHQSVNSLSVFPSRDRFVASFGTSRDGRIYIYTKNNISGLFEIEDTILLHRGFFENKRISFDNESFPIDEFFEISVQVDAVDSNTIVVQSPDIFLENLEGSKNSDALLRGSFLGNQQAYVYKKTTQDGWYLDEIVTSPDIVTDFQYNRKTIVAVKGIWLAMSGVTSSENRFSSFNSHRLGSIDLFRYNGKKYEYIRSFYSDLFSQDENGLFTTANRQAAYFAHNVNIDLDVNNEPVIVTTSRGEGNLDQGLNYVFTRNPHTHEWVTKKYNPFTSYQIKNGFELQAVGGSYVATAIDNNPDEPEGVSLFRINDAIKSTRIIDSPNWFGMMKKSWSDNPAWIIYDLLTNPVYGVGASLDDLKDINVFNFFEVAKYFDSVDDDGFYLPIFDERGRTEPRLSCNFLLEDDFNAFDVISSICDMFFGAVYIKDGKYNIWADMPRAPSWYFSNHDVMDGNFQYSDANKSSRVSLIKVPYLDKYHSFKEKVEFIEDEDLMRKNGKIEAKLDFSTFTTRSQARRFGKHYLYNKSYETEKIKFITDSKALFLNPGDVIGVEDKLKSFKNQKMFYEVSDLDHTEKIYALQPTVYNPFDNPDSPLYDRGLYNKSFVFSEITINNSSTNDFEVKNITGHPSLMPTEDFIFTTHSMTIDNNGVPYFSFADEDNKLILKMTGNSNPEVQELYTDQPFVDNTGDFDRAVWHWDTDTETEVTGNADSSLAFDSYNTPYFPFVKGTATDPEGQANKPSLSFYKLTGNNFNDSDGHWQRVDLGQIQDNQYVLDISSGLLNSNPPFDPSDPYAQYYYNPYGGFSIHDPSEPIYSSIGGDKNIIKISSNDDKYIMTYVVTQTGDSHYIYGNYDVGTGQLFLYHCSGGLDDTNPNLWNKYQVGSFNYYMDTDFDFQLVNDKPAFVYTNNIGQDTEFKRSEVQVTYKEFIGNDLGTASHWGEVYVQGSDTRYYNPGEYINEPTLSLKFDDYSVPYVLHGWHNDYLLYPTNYQNRFSYASWHKGTHYLGERGYNTQSDSRYSYTPHVKSYQLQFLQNGNALLFNVGTPEFGVGPYYSSFRSDLVLESLQFKESSDKKEWGQPHNWREQRVHKNQDTKLVTYTLFNGEQFSGSMNTIDSSIKSGPQTAYFFNGATITLKNDDPFLYENVFDIDTSIENNLEITNLFPGDITGLYKETQFENFSSKIKEEANTQSKYLTVTGFETSGGYINLFLKKGVENSRSIKDIFVNNPMVRPVAPDEDTYKEYRILNILEKDQNSYEIEAKEYHSGKFHTIDNFASMVEPEEAEFSIGLPTNEVIRPPVPVGISTGQGVDDAGSPFLTGMIIGEPNGSETEYRLSLLYPNGKIVEKEIEKDTNNLSSLNEPLTDFGFYNLAAAGDYGLNVKSLRNPESSTFINKEFTISEIRDKVSTYPFINNIGLLVNENLLKIKIESRNVYGDNLNLFDSNCRINLIIEGETYVENSKITDFEISFQQIKDLTNSSSREKEIKAQLTYNGTVISEKSEILKDEAPKITNVNFLSDGLAATIVAEVEESEKLISVDMKTGEKTIKTFAMENQNKLQTFRLEDFEISELPKKQKIDFNFVPRDFYGTGQSLNCEGFIPEEESLFEKYNNSIIGIYSIYSEDVISTGFSNYESSNNQSGFYGNGEDCLVEFSSSLLSGQSASLNLELASDTESNPVSIKFEDQGFLSSKKVMNLSQKYYNVRVSGQSGLFGGFDLKIKKLV